MSTEDIRYFDNERVNQLFKGWLKMFPCSFHQCDLDRWTEFVLSLLENDENYLDGGILRQAFRDYNHTDNDEHIWKYYMGSYHSMRDLYYLMRKKGLVL